MNKFFNALLIGLLLLFGVCSYAEKISKTPPVTPISTDRIPMGRYSTGGTPISVTVGTLRHTFIYGNQSASFSLIRVPQNINTPQAIELYESGNNGEHKVVFACNSSLSADITLTVRNDGLYKGASKVLAW
jgi:hypothetical protein